MNRRESRALTEFRQAIAERFSRFNPSLYLFGSKAEQTALTGRNEFSDIDVAVLLDRVTRRTRNAIYDLATDLSIEHEVLLSPFVITKERFQWLESLERRIALDIKKGIEL